MTREFIDNMIQRFKENKRIHKKYVRSTFERNAQVRFSEYYGM